LTVVLARLFCLAQSERARVTENNSPPVSIAKNLTHHPPGRPLHDSIAPRRASLAGFDAALL
jgi:hypothetical protein